MYVIYYIFAIRKHIFVGYHEVRKMRELNNRGNRLDI